MELFILYLLFGISCIYPCGAYLVWLIKYRKKVSLKEYWKNI